MRRFISILVFLLIVFGFNGCQPAPEKPAVVSKNDGIFQDKVNQTVSPQEEPRESSPIEINYSNHFTSSDGSVHFSVNVETDVITDFQQVFQVEPHALTKEDIQRVAEVLLDNSTFYERRSSSNPQYSKSQYRTKLNRFYPYTNQDALATLMGESGAETYMDYIQYYIQEWTESIETAQEDDPRVLCDWTLKKERYYDDSDEEIGDRIIDDDCDVVLATAEKNEIEYLYSVITKNSTGYKINRINLNLTEGLGLYPVEMSIFRSMLCRTEKPTEEQINRVTQKAYSMLEQMQLGDWECAQVYVATELINDIPEYTIHITAVPAFDGVPVILGQKEENLKESFAASYFMTRAVFDFSANGEIVYFNMDSPIDVVDEVNNTVSTLPLNDLLERAKRFLTLSDADTYGITTEDRKELEDAVEEKILCKVEISDLEYGLGRIRKQDADNTYYYVPVLAVKGFAQYVGENSGKIFSGRRNSTNDGIPPLFFINAVDGSIIY